MNADDSSARLPIAGSERAAPTRGIVAWDVDETSPAEVTVVLVSRADAVADAGVASANACAAVPQNRAYIERSAFAARFGADPADVAALEAYATASGLTIVASDLARRSVVLAGTLGALASAFDARLCRVTADGDAVRTRVGPLAAPAALAPRIAGVFGFDERVQARAHYRRAVTAGASSGLVPAAASAASLAPPDVARAYGFPAGSDGTGQTIAFVELGGGYEQTDLDTYFAALGVASPTVTSVSVDGGTNVPGGDPMGADGEVALDLEVAGSIAPGAKLVVYFAPNTDRGFLDAITTAIHDTTNAPTILSISWGGPEASFTTQSTQSFDAAFADAAMLGVTVLCAAGDGGSSDNRTDGAAHVDFPSSSPNVTACGGTRLMLAGTTVGTETVWNDAPSGGATGGGVSDVFALPAYQASANVPPSVNPGARVGRGVPDVAGDADPQTGYRVRIDGTDGVVGGTSAVAPLWAALVARVNALAKKNAGFLNPTLYANPSALRDVVSGTNGAYAAGVGWDACTGLGTPDGAKVAGLFSA